MERSNFNIGVRSSWKKGWGKSDAESEWMKLEECRMPLLQSGIPAREGES